MKGLPVIAYGAFLNEIVTFLIIAFVIFLIIKAVNKTKREEPAAATTKDCPFCFSAIPLRATRCPQCTSALQAA